jgi:hypothetical protein
MHKRKPVIRLCPVLDDSAPKDVPRSLDFCEVTNETLLGNIQKSSRLRAPRPPSKTHSRLGFSQIA